MKKINFFHFLKFLIIILLTYNIFSVFILYLPAINVKNYFWKLTPYSYKQVLNYPNYLNTIPLMNKSNRMQLLSFLDKCIYKDFLDINFWNYKLILESIDRENSDELEISFYKAFMLSKNNTKINLELRNYFIKNYSKFSKKYKNIILKNFFN